MPCPQHCYCQVGGERTFRRRSAQARVAAQRAATSAIHPHGLVGNPVRNPTGGRARSTAAVRSAAKGPCAAVPHKHVLLRNARPRLRFSQMGLYATLRAAVPAALLLSGLLAAVPHKHVLLPKRERAGNRKPAARGAAGGHMGRAASGTATRSASGAAKRAASEAAFGAANYTAVGNAVLLAAPPAARPRWQPSPRQRLQRPSRPRWPHPSPPHRQFSPRSRLQIHSRPRS
jgi:hypothetical protein